MEEVSTGRRPFVKLGIRPAGERAILACGTPIRASSRSMRKS
jgi:hypothetical protein